MGSREIRKLGGRDGNTANSFLKSLFKKYFPQEKDKMLHARHMDICLMSLKDKIVLHADNTLLGKME